MNGSSATSPCELNWLNSPQGLGQFDLLYPERKYLLTTLRSHIDTATDLLQKIPLLEQALASNEQPYLRRSMKKQLGWLRCRVKETTRQEKAILTQLNQINQEIQSRERFKQIQIERQKQQQYYQPFSDPQIIYNEIHPTESVRLNPLSTEFVPRSNGVSYLNGAGQYQQHDSQSVCYMNRNADLPKPGFSSMNEPFELGKDGPLKYYRPRDSRPLMTKRRSSSMDDGKPAVTPSHILRHQTQSLPSTPLIKEGNEEQAAEASRGGNDFGYFDLPIREHSLV